MRSRGVAWYLALSFVPAWLAWAAVAASGRGMDDPVVQLVTAAFIPALAAAIVRVWVTREGFADAGLRPRLRLHWRTYLFALALSPVFLILALGLAWILGYWDPTATVWSDHVLFLVAIPVIPVLAAPVFFGEEFGWTAYLRDRLLPGRPVATTFLTGLVWGVWHWPLPWVGYFGAHVDVSEAVIAMLLWVPLSIMLEFVIGFVWGRTGSVWPSTIVHGGGNLVVAAGMEGLTGDALSVTMSTVLYIAAMTPIVAGLLIVGRWRTVAPRPDRSAAGVTPRVGSAG